MTSGELVVLKIVGRIVGGSAKMPFIQNCSLIDVVEGKHKDPGPNSMLIQIVDPYMDFPEAKHTFHETYQFQFLDLEKDSEGADSLKITAKQARRLVDLLVRARTLNMNVIVHCVAGICRSGAVCEIGVRLGLDDTNVFRQPNLLVKYRMEQILGWAYE